MNKLSGLRRGKDYFTWQDLEFRGEVPAGTRKLENLFKEFAGQMGFDLPPGQLGGVFELDPYPLHRVEGNEVFVAAHIEPQILRAWGDQLKKYRAHLKF